MSIDQRSIRGQRGFTLIEIIAVMVFLGILTAYVTVKTTNMMDAYAGATMADNLRIHIRYAQAMAMKEKTIWGVSCGNGTYWIFNETSNPYQTAASPARIEISLASAPAFATVYFDDYGVPYSAYTSAEVNTPLASQLVYAVQKGSYSENVVITPETGFIP